MRAPATVAYNLACMSSKGRRARGLRSKIAGPALALLLLGALASPASAHGAIARSSPDAGSVVPKPPKEVTLTLAEPPGPGSSLAVTDGCGRDVSGGETIQRDAFSATITGGRPGTWNVRMRSVSSVDGHVVKESFSFKVSGKRDCSPGSDGDQGEVATSSRPPIENPDAGGTSFPIVAFALGTLVLVGVAVAIRRPWARS